MAPPRLVVDTNTAVSGILSGGAANAILRLAHDHKVTLWGSEGSFDEFCRVIRYPRIERRIRAAFRTAAAFEREYASILNLVVTSGVEPGAIVVADPDDDEFVRVAIAAKCRFIVTRDNHLLTVGSFKGISIVQPDEFMAAWNRALRAKEAARPSPARRWRLPWRKG